MLRRRSNNESFKSFDGMSGGMLALKSAGIEVDTYYASELDKFAVAESQANFPDIIQLGDVTNGENGISRGEKLIFVRW